MEAGPKGVITYEVLHKSWDSLKMRDQRSSLVGMFYGIACPVEGRGFSESKKSEIRENVLTYCLAQTGKSYNLNFFNSKTEDSFYCSQLAYLAYLKNGINLNTDLGIPHIPGTSSIIFPQEIWSGCVNKKA